MKLNKKSTKPLKISLLLYHAACLLLLNTINGFEYLGNQQSMKAVAGLNHQYGGQLHGTTTFVYNARNLHHIYYYDVLAGNFETSTTPLGSFRSTGLKPRALEVPLDSPDLVLVIEKEVQVVSFSQQALLSTLLGPTVFLRCAGTIKGSNMVWTGGNDKRLFLFDYTDPDNSPPQREGTADPDTIRTLSMMVPEANNEMAVGLNTQKIYFVDRTGDLNFDSKLRSYQTQRGNVIKIQQVSSHSTKLIYFEENFGFLIKIDYSNPQISSDYDQAVCTSAIKEVSQITGGSLALVACSGNQIHLVDLLSGLTKKSLTSSQVGMSVIVMEGWRLAISTGYHSSNFNTEMRRWNMKAEIPCHSSCGSCDWISTKYGCLSCIEQGQLQADGSCVLTCRGDQYQSSLWACSDCDSTCKTCSGGGRKECTSCNDGFFLLQDHSCVTEVDYSMSLVVEGIEGSGEVSYYLRIELEPKDFTFDFERLDNLIKKKHFSIEADSVVHVGDASYNNVTKVLEEEGRVSSTSLNSIEYLVYKAPSPLPDDEGDFTLKITGGAEIFEKPVTQLAFVIKHVEKSQSVSIKEIKGSTKTKSILERILKESLSSMKIAGSMISIVSTFLLMNSLEVLVKFFQSVEVIINLSLVNTKLGSLIDRVVEILRTLKFPLKLPEDLFWPDYVTESHILFWKDRFKLSVQEKQLFILCNETLMVILYLTIWLLWLAVLGVKKLCYGGGLGEKEKGGKNQDYVLDVSLGMESDFGEKSSNQGQGRRSRGFGERTKFGMVENGSSSQKGGEIKQRGKPMNLRELAKRGLKTTKINKKI